jgi:NmrA-like family
MTQTIAVAGATGDLGKRITRALIARGAKVIALSRKGSPADKQAAVAALGATVATVDPSSAADLAKATEGASCVVSAVQGLRDVIIDAQTALLEAAIASKVPRFIPSDFSTDFTQQAPGENRNFDLRREFHTRLDKAAIVGTAIFNGAFAEILTYNVPLLDFANKRIGYWGDADWRIDFTTMDDTAAFTAAAAMDEKAPAALRIASFQLSAQELQAFTAQVMKTPYELVRMGSRDELAAYNKRERAAHPEGEREIMPTWQRTQYSQSMITAHHAALDNARYPDLKWTSLETLLKNRPTGRPGRG